MSRLILADVAIGTSRRWLFEGLEMSVGGGEIAVVMGPSGCGKSTLLAWIGGFLPESMRARGTLTYDGRSLVDLAPQRRRTGILFQDDLLFPHMTVWQNLGFGLRESVRGRARRRAIDEALEAIELQGYQQAFPDALSGGQRARVSLMRTLLSQPNVLLLDEPYARLDQALRGRMRQLVVRRVRKEGLPTLLVTHDPADIPDDVNAVVELSGSTGSPGHGSPGHGSRG